MEGDQYDIRVADFGLACFTPKDEPVFDKCGSPGSIAPEMFKDSGYSYKADIFSLGCVFFNILTSKYLFKGDSAMEILMYNSRCNLNHIKSFIAHISEPGRNLLYAMLKKDPVQRPTAKEAL